MPENHEIWPNAPLALVVVEVRFPTGAGESSRLPMILLRAFRDLLGDEWVIEPAKSQQVSFAIGPGGPLTPISQAVTIPRFTVRDRTLAVAITEESATIETTAYRHYPEFRSVIERVLSATADVFPPDGVSRVGMRYINEIQHPQGLGDQVLAWSEWIDPSLLPPRLSLTESEGLAATAWEGASQYRTGPNQILSLHYGLRPTSFVNPGGPLRRSSCHTTAPFFVLDFDCFWQPPGIPAFEPEAIVSTCDRLRAPIRSLLDLLLTDKLVAEFRKEAL